MAFWLVTFNEGFCVFISYNSTLTIEKTQTNDSTQEDSTNREQRTMIAQEKRRIHPAVPVELHQSVPTQFRLQGLHFRLAN